MDQTVLSNPVPTANPASTVPSEFNRMMKLLPVPLYVVKLPPTYTSPLPSVAGAMARTSKSNPVPTANPASTVPSWFNRTIRLLPVLS